MYNITLLMCAWRDVWNFASQKFHLTPDCRSCRWWCSCCMWEDCRWIYAAW